jgi:hypothetical protein
MRLAGVCLGAACWTGPALQAPARPEPEATAPPRPRTAEPPRTRLEQIMLATADFTDRMCGCTDKVCVDQVTDDYTKWTQEMAQHANDAPLEKPDDDQLKQMTETIKRYASCMTAAMSSVAPAP